MAEDLRETNLLLLRLLRASEKAREEKAKVSTGLRCSGCYRDIRPGTFVYHGNFCHECVEGVT